MNKTLRTTLIVLVVLIGAMALVWTGFSFGRATAWGMAGYYPGAMHAQSGFDMMGYDQDDHCGFGMSPGNMMGNWGYEQNDATAP